MRNFAHRVWNAMPMAWRISPIGRFLSACYRLTYHDLYGLRSLFALLARTARLLLLAAGLPLKRQFLVLRCGEGVAAVGLFSEFTTVLGALEHYERWQRQYAGLRVDFATHGLYYDAAFGANWWGYYFAPLEIGSSKGAATTAVTYFRRELFADAGEGLSRERGFELIDRYVRPKPHIRAKVETYVREHFLDAFVIGIHCRGTDKVEEASRVPYPRIRATVLEAIKAASPTRYKLFLATDEQAFLDYMLAEFPDVLTYRRMFRSVDGAPTHLRETSNHDKGEDAVVDCLLLSRCSFLVRTESNLSTCATLFNPGLPQVRLNRPYHSPDLT